MKCALCQHRAKFEHVGRRHDGGKVFRCPRCKLDQYKAIGTGAYLMHGSYDLDVPAETSLYKARWERALVDGGVIRREQMTQPESKEEIDRIVREHAAGVAEQTGHDDLAQMMRQRPPEAEPPAPDAPASGPAESATPALVHLTHRPKGERARRLMAVLDEVLIEALSEAGINVESWNAGNREFFTAFARGILVHALSAHDQTQACGAAEDDQPYLQLLFGLRPALENANGAWFRAGSSTEQSPLGALAALAGPFQMVIGDKVTDQQAFIRVQQRVYEF